MSWVIAAPEYVAAAAADLANVGSTLEFANSFAAGPTSSVFPPGADEVSASIAALFDAHSQAYQELSAQAAAFHAQFVQLMNGGAEQYALTEAANASPLQTTQHALSPTGSAGQALTSAPSLAGSAATPASAVASVPAATAGLAGSAPPAAVTPAATIAPAPPPVTPSTVTPVGAGPV
ncbi:PE family protein, partial [Mycobacterium bohemicum]